MTIYDADWVAAEEEKRAWLAENAMYRAEDEHSSCGVGLVVSVDGKKSRKVVEAGIKALKAIWHRGAVDADGKTGDGAGIHVQIPVPFFYDQIERTGHKPKMNELMAVGQVFLPRTNFGAQETCRTIVETEVLRMGHYDLWLAARAGGRDLPRREGQRDASRDRADHHLERQGRRRGAFRARALRDPAADREGGGGGGDHPDVHRLAVLPVDHLQGDDAGRAGGGVLSRPDGPALRERLRDLPPALFHQHLPAMVAGPALPDAGP